MQANRKSGFTLIELLVVLAIIVALFAILAPNILSYRHKSNVRRAETQIKNFQRALEAYAADTGRYPSTEQGLKSLIYFPANETTGMTAMNAMQGMQPGSQDGMLAGGQGNSMAGAATSVGGVNMQPGAGMGMDQTGMNMGQPQGMGMGMGMDQTGMNMGQPQGMGMDQTGAGMGTQPQGMGMDQTGAGMGGTALPVGMSDPNLYVNARKRPDPYLEDDDVLLDPWRRPYRFDNTVTASGVNRFTGERKPAIWSAGYDGIDGNEDDVRNWDPQVAAQQLMHAQQGSGMGQQQGMGMGMDQTGMNMGQPQGMGMGMDQTGMNMGQPQGMGMGTQPQGMGMGTQPQGMGMGTQPQGMGMGTQPQGMGMGTQPQGMNMGQPQGMGMGTQPQGMGMGAPQVPGN